MCMNKVNQFLLEHNHLQRELFSSPDEVARRKEYQRLHKTPVMVNKCMDGRVNVSPMTDGEVPMGIISPYRNMGGKFVIGSPSYAHFVRNFYEHVEEKMEHHGAPGGLLLVTYHFSAGDHHRGCKGFGYDTDAARAYTRQLKLGYEEVYGSQHRVVHPIHMGIETDHEAFIFHGEENGDLLDMSAALDLSPQELQTKIRSLYPTMREGVLADLMPFVIGNQRHVRKVIQSHKVPDQLEHKENIIAVGRGFDWLHIINKALIVGPFSIDWLAEVVVASNIVLDNIKAGRVKPEDGVVLLVSAPHREPGVDEAVARKKAIEMATASWKVITTHEVVSELLNYNLEPVVGTLDRSTMEFNRLDFTPSQK